jgi:hypothetical protein
MQFFSCSLSRFGILICVFSSDSIAVIDFDILGPKIILERNCFHET